ncbi:hypothetical protein WCLP8_10015 [uncultured Gammaproteobacteria bacterium]
MKHNLGSHHRLLHGVAGIAALAAVLFYPGTSGWLGVIGVVLIGSALLAWCPGRALLGRITGCCGCGCSGTKTKTDSGQETSDKGAPDKESSDKGPCCGTGGGCGGEKKPS